MRKALLARRDGFTLIELLIVVTLIGILAVAVLAALNPIEQINKSRDAARKSDASQLISALDRYFVSKEQFPWNTHDDSPPDEGFVATADAYGVGVCGDSLKAPNLIGLSTESGAGSGGCTEDEGWLISAQELKDSYTNRKYFDSTPGINNVLYVVKLDSQSTVNVCFIPSSKAERTSPNVKDLYAGGSLITPSATEIAACDLTSGEPGYTAPNDACFICLPEEE